MERITVTVCWVAPTGTLEALRKAGDEFVAGAASEAATFHKESLIFVNATSEEA